SSARSATIGPEVAHGIPRPLRRLVHQRLVLLGPGPLAPCRGHHAGPVRAPLGDLQEVAQRFFFFVAFGFARDRFAFAGIAFEGFALRDFSMTTVFNRALGFCFFPRARGCSSSVGIFSRGAATGAWASAPFVFGFAFERGDEMRR